MKKNKLKRVGAVAQSFCDPRTTYLFERIIFSQRKDRKPSPVQLKEVKHDTE